MITEIKDNTIYALIDGVKYRYNKAGLLDFWCENPCQDWKQVENHIIRNEIINIIIGLQTRMN
jgi:hypothetical protein